MLYDNREILAKNIRTFMRMRYELSQIYRLVASDAM